MKVETFLCVCGHDVNDHRPAVNPRYVASQRQLCQILHCGCTKYQHSIPDDAKPAVRPTLVRLADYGRVYCSICHHAGLVRRDGPAKLNTLGIVESDSVPQIPKDWIVVKTEDNRPKLVCSSECAKVLMMGPTPPRPRRGA